MTRGVTHLLRISRAWSLTTFVLKFTSDWSMNLASMIAYNLITAIFPILLVLLSLVGLLVQGHLHEVSTAIGGVFPEARQSNIAVTPLLRGLVQITGPLGIVSFVVLLWLGSNLFSTMENAFSIIFRIRGRELVPQRLMAIGMVLVLAVLLPVSLGAASLVTTGSADVGRLLPRQGGQALAIVGPLTSVGVLWLLFMAIYLVVPNFEVRIRQAWRGALVAAVLFGLLQLLFPLYFQVFLTGNSRYGAAAASILVLIIWLWFFAVITVVGAQINAVLMGLRETPYDLGRTFELAYGQHDNEVDLKRITAPTRLKKLRARLRLPGRKAAAPDHPHSPTPP